MRMNNINNKYNTTQHKTRQDKALAKTIVKFKFTNKITTKKRLCNEDGSDFIHFVTLLDDVDLVMI